MSSHSERPHEADPQPQAADEPADEPGTEEVGTLGEEAVKLFATISGLAREHLDFAQHDPGHGLADHLDDARAHASAAARHLGEQLDGSPAECRTCPVCRTVHAVREVDPEVWQHLREAATSVGRAFSSLLHTADRSAGTDE